MNPGAYKHQPPTPAKETPADPDASAKAERTKQTGASAQPGEQSARSVMHPDHHDPDWSYYFGAVVG